MHLVRLCPLLLLTLIPLRIICSENKETTIEESKHTKEIDRVSSDGRPKRGQHRNELSRVEHKEKIVETYHHIVKKILPPFDYPSLGESQSHVRGRHRGKVKNSRKFNLVNNVPSSRIVVNGTERDSTARNSKANHSLVDSSEIAKGHRKKHAGLLGHRSDVLRHLKIRPRSIYRRSPHVAASSDVAGNLPKIKVDNNASRGADIENEQSDLLIDALSTNLRSSDSDHDSELVQSERTSDNSNSNKNVPVQPLRVNSSAAENNIIAASMKHNDSKRHSYVPAHFSKRHPNRFESPVVRSPPKPPVAVQHWAPLHFANRTIAPPLPSNKSNSLRDLDRLYRLLQYGLAKNADDGFKTRSEHLVKKKVVIFRNHLHHHNDTDDDEESTKLHNSSTSSSDVAKWFLGLFGLMVVAGMAIMIVLLALQRHANRDRLPKTWDRQTLARPRYARVPTHLDGGAAGKRPRLGEEDEMEARLAEDAQVLNEAINQAMRNSEFLDRTMLRRMYSTPQHSEVLANAMAGNVE